MPPVVVTLASIAALVGLRRRAVWAYARHRPGRALGSAASMAALVLFFPSHVPWIVLAASLVRPSLSRGWSMFPTLPTHSLGLVLPSTVFPIRRGDVVGAYVAGRLLGKRVIALGGDRVESGPSGIRVNGAPAVGSVLPADLGRIGPYAVRRWTVKAGRVFLLGDHVCSRDSRAFGTVPLADVVGRYVELVGFGRPVPVTLDPEDAADVAVIRAGDPPSRPALDAMIAAGGFDANDLAAVVHQALHELGDKARLEESLRRRLARSPEARWHAHWAWLLAGFLQREERPADVLLAVEAAGDRPRNRRRELWTSQVWALNRIARWAEAEPLAAEILRRWPRASRTIRLPSLIGLGRLDDADREMAAVRNWGTPSWRPWFEAYLATARGDLEPAADQVLEALATKLPIAARARTAPLLAPLRASPSWVRVEAALAGSATTSR